MIFQHMTYVLICRDVMLGFVQSISMVGMDCTSGRFMKFALISFWIKNDIASKNLNYLREPSYGNIDDRKIYAMHIFRKHLPLTRVLGKETLYIYAVTSNFVDENSVVRKNAQYFVLWTSNKSLKILKWAYSSLWPAHGKIFNATKTKTYEMFVNK